MGDADGRCGANGQAVVAHAAGRDAGDDTLRHYGAVNPQGRASPPARPHATLSHTVVRLHASVPPAARVWVCQHQRDTAHGTPRARTASWRPDHVCGHYTAWVRRVPSATQHMVVGAAHSHAPPGVVAALSLHTMCAAGMRASGSNRAVGDEASGNLGGRPRCGG